MITEEEGEILRGCQDSLHSFDVQAQSQCTEVSDEQEGKAYTRYVDVEKKVLSQRGRARSDIEMRMAVGRGKLIEKIVREEKPCPILPSIEVKIHDGEWLVGTMDPDDLTYVEKVVNPFGSSWILGAAMILFLARRSSLWEVF